MVRKDTRLNIEFLLELFIERRVDDFGITHYSDRVRPYGVLDEVSIVKY